MAIVSDSKICAGAPRIKGRRLTVYDIVARLFFEKNTAVVMEDMDLTLEEIKEAVAFCRTLKCKNSLNFCVGCILRSIKDRDMTIKGNVIETDLAQGEKIVIDGNNVYLGDLQEYRDHKFGKLAWVMAESVQSSLNEPIK